MARKPKLDTILADAVDVARDALAEIAGAQEVGDHLGVFAEGERLVTHRFVSQKKGYQGWTWFATLARVPRAKSKDLTVCEVGIIAGEQSLLAPAWVPWADRLAKEEIEAAKAAEAAEAAKEEKQDEKEKQGTTGVIFWVSMLFFIGVAFGYFILTPLMVNFYFGFTLSEMITIRPTFSDYLENLMYSTVGIGLLFQMPLLILALAKAGIITASSLRSYRRHAFVAILIAAAIITPTTDPFSLSIVTVPLYLLFEISITLAARGEKQQAEKEIQEWS